MAVSATRAIISRCRCSSTLPLTSSLRRRRLLFSFSSEMRWRRSSSSSNVPSLTQKSCGHAPREAAARRGSKPRVNGGGCVKGRPPHDKGRPPHAKGASHASTGVAARQGRRRVEGLASGPGQP
eukprot:3445820-Prymnesium_polylepis.1